MSPTLPVLYFVLGFQKHVNWGLWGGFFQSYFLSCFDKSFCRRKKMHFYGKEEKKIIQFWVGNRISGIEIDFSLENSPYLLKD